MKSRTSFNPQHPYRTKRPASSKIIFLSCEGTVTEEEYFERLSSIFDGIKYKIQFISVAEDAIKTTPKKRSEEQNKLLGKSRPLQLVERIDQFKKEKDDIYQFNKHPDDEFWMITDVDEHWSSKIANPTNGKTQKDEWNEAISKCNKEGYSYAVSNPFFEMWLLLHFDEALEADKKYAVTPLHDYEPTNHFKKRLNDLGHRLKHEKHIKKMDYEEANVRDAVSRAEQLHKDKEDLCPQYYATTIYLLVYKILELVS